MRMCDRMRMRRSIMRMREGVFVLMRVMPYQSICYYECRPSEHYDQRNKIHPRQHHKIPQKMIDLTKIDIENELWPEDAKLFEQMEGNYQSENEKTFFENIHVKMLSELAPCRELLLSENDNNDQIYFLRDQYEEFIVGTTKKPSPNESSIHTMTLIEALEANLKELGFLDRDISFWQWLRERDYENMKYDHNYAYM